MPVWLASWFFSSCWKYLAGAVVLALIAASYGYVHHKGVLAGVAKEQVNTQKVSAEYSGYRATVSSAVAASTAHAMSEQKRLQSTIDDLQTKLLETQRTANAKSEALKSILAGAKASDMRPVGPVAGSYYDRLRADAADRAAGP